MHRIEISITTTKYFDNQKEMAEFLDIKNTSKKAISSRCKLYGYGLYFDSYNDIYNLEIEY